MVYSCYAFYFSHYSNSFNKENRPKPLAPQNSLIEATQIKINIQSIGKEDTNIRANWAQVQNLPHSENIIIVCNGKVFYNGGNNRTVTADQAEILIERKNKLDYSLRVDNILVINFKKQVSIQTTNEFVKTKAARYLPQKK